MRTTMLSVVTALVLAALPLTQAHAQDAASSGYLTPPQAIVDILDAPRTPQVVVSPTRDTLALLERKGMPSLADLARPMLRLAGSRIDPKTNGPHRRSDIMGLTLLTISDGSSQRVAVPSDASIGSVRFSPNGSRLAFTVTRDAGIELWVADVSTGRARSLTDASLNATWGNPCSWLADNETLLCSFVQGNRGPAPEARAVPAGPNVQENAGVDAPLRTYQDLLRNPHDEALFEYYFTRRLAIVNARTGDRTSVGGSGLFERFSASPSGEFFLVVRLKRPFSWLTTDNRFPKDVEVWNRRGEVVRTLADLPLADQVPIGGVPTGPRGYGWKPTDPATLIWAEALDEGDPKREVPHRDRVLTLSAPFTTPTELTETEFRFGGVSWTERGDALIRENDRKTRRTRSWLMYAGSGDPRRLWDRSTEDRYRDPGSPLTRQRGNAQVILQDEDSIYLRGRGASPQGDRPFLDRLNLNTLQTERVFQADEGSYEEVVSLLADDGTQLLTRRETRTDPPNYFVRDMTAGTVRQLTTFTDPAPQLRGITKELLTYEREDGVTLSATLYLPPDYREGQRLPVLVWAYPREFTNAAVASQVVGSPDRFTAIRGASHLLLLTQGYAILDGPTMPIIGAGETANDTYVEQLVASAEAAIDTIVDMGVADRDRIAIGGHSYGAFMTANLLAHSDLFQAGIARSGAYNRTLTPFGFQSERRTFWEAREVYAAMSPFFHADKVNEPILLTHGEADNNSGTFPIQSARFYMALKGHGATVRYVTLPYESHGYAARESVLHTVAEMLNWCDKYLKTDGARETTGSVSR